MKKKILYLAKLVGIVVIIIAGLIIWSVAGKFGRKSSEQMIGKVVKNEQLPPIGELILKTSNELNGSFPSMIGEDVRIDTSHANGNMLIFKLTLVNSFASQIDKASFISQAKNGLVGDLCSDEDAIYMFDMGGVYAYDVYSKDGISVALIEISRSDCN